MSLVRFTINKRQQSLQDIVTWKSLKMLVGYGMTSLTSNIEFVFMISIGSCSLLLQVL